MQAPWNPPLNRLCRSMWHESRCLLMEGHTGDHRSISGIRWEMEPRE